MGVNKLFGMVIGTMVTVLAFGAALYILNRVPVLNALVPAPFRG